MSWDVDMFWRWWGGGVEEILDALLVENFWPRVPRDMEYGILDGYLKSIQSKKGHLRLTLCSKTF